MVLITTNYVDTGLRPASCLHDVEGCRHVSHNCLRQLCFAAVFLAQNGPKKTNNKVPDTEEKEQRNI